MPVCKLAISKIAWHKQDDEAVYAAIADVTRMGEWSEECHSCEWDEGHDAPVVGATFAGHNRNGEHEWTSQCRIIEAEPGRALYEGVGSVSRGLRGGSRMEARPEPAIDVALPEGRAARRVSGVDGNDRATARPPADGSISCRGRP